MEIVLDSCNYNKATGEDKRLLEQIENNYSEHTKALFGEFVLIYNEVKLLGIDPEQLSRVWRNR